MKKNLLPLCLAVILFAVSPTFAAEPTHANLRYGKDYERSVLDLWKGCRVVGSAGQTPF